METRILQVIEFLDKMPLKVEAREYVGENAYCQQNYTECVRNGQSITIEDKNFRT